VTQVQTAQQQAVSVQILQTGAQLAGVSGQAGSSAPGQSAATVTQIQIGCIAQCFETSSSNPATATAAQQILAELGSILAPPDLRSPAPVPGTEQSVTNQTSCQQLNGLPSSLSQAQSASESSTSVQLIEGTLASVLESSLGGSEPGLQAVSQTVQGTWQLQIGCLFYCTASEQTQDAQESSTTVEGATGTSGGGFVATVTQVVWQVQIGCIAWCYGTSQVQEESTQSTVVLITGAPPGARAPGPEPISGQGTSASEPPGTATASPRAPADPPPATAPSSAPAVLLVRLTFPTGVGKAGLEMVGALHHGPAAAVSLVTRPSTWSPARSVESVDASLTVAREVGSRHGAVRHRRHVVHPAPRLVRSKHAARAVLLQARAGGGPGIERVGILLVLLAAALAYATFRVRAQAGPNR
jgi:hypothetical protein